MILLIRKHMDKTSYPNWYGAETGSYADSGKPGVYHGLPIRESDEVGWFKNPKNSVPRSKIKKIIEELSKLKGVDTKFYPPAEYEKDGLGFGWTVDENRSYADDDMVKKIDEILYGKNMNKVSFLPKVAKDEKPGLWANIRAKKRRGEKPAKPGDKDFPDKEQWNKLTKQSSDASFLPKLAKSPAWQRSEGKNSEGGLNAKGRSSYNKETGGNLKAPVTEKNPSGKRETRQNSFCSRMCGMKSKRTGSETKNDPDSRINKALRKWRCRCG